MNNGSPAGPDPGTGEFAPVLDQLAGPALATLDTRLASLTGLGTGERQIIRDSTAARLRRELWRRVSRLLVLELNAARVTGRLTAASSSGRWQQWLAEASAPGYWDGLTDRYPDLLPRLGQLAGNQGTAAVDFAERFSADRAALATLGVTACELTGLSLGEGDSHQGGQTVARVELAGGRVVYKPRSLAVDQRLGRLLPELLPDQPESTRIRTARVICRGSYGWAEHIAHRYCADETELAAFYRGIGHWLAVTQLLSASDLHAENLIAAGPVPVVVDCETLFTPQLPQPATGYGRATDLALALVAGSALRTGLLPVRGQALGLRGADFSAVGRLPGQQPRISVPVIAAAGTDQARLAFATVSAPSATNHPAPQPALERHWDAVLEGFGELTTRLRAHDRAGLLEPLLAGLRDCRVRVVTRDTLVYQELARMLWHPVSLHEPGRARRRAADLLIRHGQRSPLSSTDPAVIDAELTDLLTGDIPLFTAVAGQGRLTGQDKLTAAEYGDLVTAALHRWRALDPSLDQQITRAAVVSAYFNDSGIGRADDQPPARLPVRPQPPREAHRRQIVADTVSQIAEAAVAGDDQTVTWVAPTLDSTGWSVRPLSGDLYSGLAGIAVALAGYQHEAAAGRVNPLPAAGELLQATLRSLRAIDDQTTRRQAMPAPQRQAAARPEPPGGYVGLGSRIWSWLLLHRLDALAADEAASRARAHAALLPDAVAADEHLDLLSGMAGAVVPLLRLAALTGEQQWSAAAVAIGNRLADAAVPTGDTARWRGARAPDGLGGLAHGGTGIGWALDRLAAATGTARFAELAQAAFRFEDGLYEAELGGWRDLRKPAQAPPWWCHGAAGIGLVAADRLPRITAPERSAALTTLRRAAAACWRDGMGITHTLCHGDLGSWEVLASALAAGVGPDGLDRPRLDGYLLASLWQHGARCNLTVDVFMPGLLHGLAGVVYQLLRLHPDSDLPSVLLPDPDI